MCVHAVWTCSRLGSGYGARDPCPPPGARHPREPRVAGTAIIGFRPGDDSLLLLSMLYVLGAALILDEFALILHLDDVYWTTEGRSSVEATLMGD